MVVFSRCCSMASCSTEVANRLRNLADFTLSRCCLLCTPAEFSDHFFSQASNGHHGLEMTHSCCGCKQHTILPSPLLDWRRPLLASDSMACKGWPVAKTQQLRPSLYLLYRAPLNKEEAAQHKAIDTSEPLIMTSFRASSNSRTPAAQRAQYSPSL